MKHKSSENSYNEQNQEVKELQPFLNEEYFDSKIISELWKKTITTYLTKKLLKLKMIQSPTKISPQELMDYQLRLKYKTLNI